AGSSVRRLFGYRLADAGADGCRQAGPRSAEGRQIVRGGLVAAGKHLIFQAVTDESGMTAVTVTEQAARKIGEILGREAPGAKLRVSVEGGGCSGFQYKFDIEHEQAS